MYKVLTFNEIAQRGIGELQKAQFTVSDNEENPNGIIIRSHELPLERLSTNLLAIARAGADVSTIPVESCSEKGIVVFNTPGATTNAVKELVLAGLLLASRDIVGGIRWAQSLANQHDVVKLIDKGNSRFAGPEVAGKNLGVIGLGGIGVQVANACRTLGMRVLGYDPDISVDAAWSLSRGVRKAQYLDSLLEECDYLTIHVPHNIETAGMFDADAFSKCKKGVRLLNFSHTDIVDNAALLEALDNGTVHRYVTDFPTPDLLGHDNIITMPHLGAITPESRENCATMAATHLRDYLLYGNIKNSVNFSDCVIPYAGKKRVCIIHRNVIGIAGPIISLFSTRNINIDNMISRSSGEYGYTMIDVDCNSLDGIEAELQKIASIIKVRLLEINSGNK